jgi:hypothetical protein
MAGSVGAPVDSSAMFLDETWDPAPFFDLKMDSAGPRVEVIKPEQYDDLLASPNKAEEPPSTFMAGYRVQLVSTRNETEARSSMQGALTSFSENVYLLYDSPYYKLRVGDCLLRADADSLQQRAIQKGFSSAWIIRSQVYVHPPPKLGQTIAPADSSFLNP